MTSAWWYPVELLIWQGVVVVACEIVWRVALWKLARNERLSKR